MDRGNEGQFAGSFTGCGPPPQQRQQRSQQQQHRPPQHLQQQRFSGHQAGSTPFSGEERGSGWASSTAFHQRHVGGRAGFSGDTGQSGTGAATAFLPPHPSPSPATAKTSMSAPDIIGPGESGAYVPVFWGVLPGGMSGFGAEGVAVDENEKLCQASLSVTGAADITAVDAVAILG